MRIDDIIRDLSGSDQLPEAAIRAAREQKEALVPRFIAAIEDFIVAEDERRLEPTPLLIAFFLLGEWREKSGCKPLLRLLSLPEGDLEIVFGFDGLSETAQRVMAAVFDGDTQAFYDFILDPSKDGLLRWQMFEALAILVFRGEVDREEAAGFMRRCYDALDPKVEEPWYGWQLAIAHMRLVDLVPLVQEAFARGLIGAEFGDFEDFEQDLQAALDDPDNPNPFWGGDFTLFGDTIEELSGWTWGDNDGSWQVDPFADGDGRDLPATTPLRHVGRNDPCPCGSGKKYKKCCLG